MCPEEGGAATPYLVHPNLLDSPFCGQEGQACHFETVTRSTRREEEKVGRCGKVMWEDPLPKFALQHLEMTAAAATTRQQLERIDAQWNTEEVTAEISRVREGVTAFQ